MVRQLCAALLGLVIPVSAAAQSLPPVSSDRPDFTEGTGTVPLGHVQIEGGTTWQEIGDDLKKTPKWAADARTMIAAQ